MFSWVCQQCGLEVPPAHSECPNCTKKVAAASSQREGNSGAATAATPAPAFRPVGPIGQYTISREGRTYGPYTAEEVRNYLGNGDLTPADLVWNEASAQWVPIDDLFGQRRASPPPPPRLDPPVRDSTPIMSFETTAQKERRRSRTDKVALYTREVLGAVWFFAPFITVGRQSSTILDLSSDGLWRFIGIVTITLPFLAVKSSSFLVRCLYLLPIAYVALMTYLTLAYADALRAQMGSAPLFGDLMKLFAPSVMFDYGAYIFAVTALVLVIRMFSGAGDQR